MTERRPATDLYLIRHGESHANIDGVISAMATDRGLTERGLAQVRALAARLETGEIPADALYASTLPRARMTAEIVAAALDLPVEWNDDLHELRPGEAEGLHVGEVRERFPQVARFIGEPFTPLAPGGESWAPSRRGSPLRWKRSSGDTRASGSSSWRTGGLSRSPACTFSDWGRTLGRGSAFPRTTPPLPIGGIVSHSPAGVNGSSLRITTTGIWLGWKFDGRLMGAGRAGPRRRSCAHRSWVALRTTRPCYAPPPLLDGEQGCRAWLRASLDP
jgi:hypothetical protein